MQANSEVNRPRYGCRRCPHPFPFCISRLWRQICCKFLTGTIYCSYWTPCRSQAENEAFGHAEIAPENAQWLCNMSATIRANLHPNILISTGGGGIGRAAQGSPLEFWRAQALAKCPAVDVVALHSYAAPDTIDRQLTGYAKAIAPAGKRLILQEWGAVGINSTAQAEAFAMTAAVAAKHGTPQLFWALQPSHVPLPSTELAVSPPSPAPSPGEQRIRGTDGRWVNRCSATSCPTEVWVTALYPAAQAAAIQPAAANWPEVSDI